MKIGNDGRRHYTYDQLSVIAESEPGNATVSKYDYGLDQLVSLDDRTDGRGYFHLDILGSTVSLTSAAGAIVQTILYDAWGNERERVGESANRFTFTGHELDEETGLIYAKARFYDPDVGRFLTQDSVLGNVNDPPSLHRYAYTRSNPTAFTDPSGETPLLATAAAGALIGAGFNIVRQTLAIAEGSQDEFEWGQLGTSVVAGAAFGLGAPFLAATAVGPAVLTGVGTVFVGLGIGSGIQGIAEGRPLTGGFDAVSSVLGVGGLLKGAGALRVPRASTPPIASQGGTLRPRAPPATRSQPRTRPRLEKPAGKPVRSRAANIQESGPAATKGTAPPGAPAPKSSYARTRASYREGLRRGYTKAQTRQLIQEGKLCFVAGTPVWTSEGRKVIEEIELGDHVLSMNEASGELEYKEVVDTFNRFSERILEIQIQGEPEPIGATPEHPFFTYRPRDSLEDGDDIRAPVWIPADELEVGDLVLRPSGEWTVVASVVALGHGEQVFNFTVLDNHNYFVGEHGVLVHNKCVEPIPTSRQIGPPGDPGGLKLRGRGGKPPRQIGPSGDPGGTRLRRGDVREQRRDAKGRFLPKAGGEVAPGSKAVDSVELRVRQKPGIEVVGREVSFRDANTGQLRRFDLVIRTRSGKIVGIEVKSGGATRTREQRVFDRALNATRRPFPAVGNAAARLGVDEINRTILITIK